MSLDTHLQALFDADRAAHTAEARLLKDGDQRSLSGVLTAAVDHALKLADQAEAQRRLTRLSDLCAQVQGGAMAQALICILGSDDATIRVAAGEALRDFAFDRYAEVARAIEQCLEAGGHERALQELPWVLAEVGEPSAVPLIARFLQHDEAEVVASAIEACAELGDPAALPHLQALAEDARVAEIDEGDASYSATLGELACEAAEGLSG